MDPVEAIVLAGSNVTFSCSHPENGTFLWDFSSKIRSYSVTHGAYISNHTLKPIYYSKITIYEATRYMSGEIACSVDNGNSKAVGFLIVNGNVYIFSNDISTHISINCNNHDSYMALGFI